MLKNLLKNPQIKNVMIAVFFLFILLTILRFVGLYEGMEQDIIVDDDMIDHTTNQKASMMVMPGGGMPPMPPIPRGFPQGVPKGVSQPTIPIT